MKDKRNAWFERFLDLLEANIKINGGTSIKDELRKETIESLYKNLFLNGIIIKFENFHLKSKYRDLQNTTRIEKQYDENSGAYTDPINKGM